jgi:hypothetical protein
LFILEYVILVVRVGLASTGGLSPPGCVTTATDRRRAVRLAVAQAAFGGTWLALPVAAKTLARSQAAQAGRLSSFST